MMDECDPNADDAVANTGLKKRSVYSARSRTIDMTGPLHSDIFMQDKLLLSGIDLKVKLTPAKSGFCLISNDPQGDYKVTITHATLLVRRVKVSPSVSLSHARALEMGTARYPLNRGRSQRFLYTRWNYVLL